MKAIAKAFGVAFGLVTGGIIAYYALIAAFWLAVIVVLKVLG